MKNWNSLKGSSKVALQRLPRLVRRIVSFGPVSYSWRLVAPKAPNYEPGEMSHPGYIAEIQRIILFASCYRVPSFVLNLKRILSNNT